MQKAVWQKVRAAERRALRKKRGEGSAKAPAQQAALNTSRQLVAGTLGSGCRAAGLGSPARSHPQRRLRGAVRAVGLQGT